MRDVIRAKHEARFDMSGYPLQTFFTEHELDYEIESLIATGWDTHIYEADLQAVEKIFKTNELCPVCQCITPKHSLISTPKGRACPDCKK